LLLGIAGQVIKDDNETTISSDNGEESLQVRGKPSSLIVTKPAWVDEWAGSAAAIDARPRCRPSSLERADGLDTKKKKTLVQRRQHRQRVP
jgi:hypothetical protein